MAGQGTVTVRVIGNVAGLKTSMSEAEATTKGSMDRIGASAEGAAGHFANLTKHAGGVMAAVGGFGALAVGISMLKGAGDAAVDDQKAMSSLMQAMQTGGEQMGPVFARNLQQSIDAGTKLGFTSADTTNALAHMREAGITTAQGMSALPAIYDLARAKGLDLDTATKAVVMGMQGQGRALKDLNVELPPAVTSAKALETAQKKLNDAVAQHGPNSKQAVAALQALQTAQEHAAGGTLYLDQITQTLEDRLGGQAQAATQTAAGGWEAFTAQMKEVGGQIMGAAMPAITGLVNTLAPVIVQLVQGLSPAIQGIVLAIGPVVQSTMQALMPALKAIVPAVSQIMGAVAPLIVQMNSALAPAFTMIIKTVAPVIAQMATELAPVFSKVISAAAPLITDLVKDFLPIFKDLAPLLVPIVQLLGEVLVPILGLMDKAIQALNPVMQAFGNVAKTVFGGVIDAAQHVWDFFKNAVGIIGDIFHKIGDAISAPFKAAFDLIADLWNNTVGRLNFTIPGWVPGIGGDHFGMPTIPKMHMGGVVPGNPGDESLAILQAGERVIPAGKQGAMVGVQNIYAVTNSDPQTIANAVVRGLRTGSRTVFA